MTGFLLFLLTIDSVPHYLYIVPFLYLLYKKRNEVVTQILSKKIDRNYLIILTIIVLGFVNLLIGSGFSIAKNELMIPYTTGMIFAYFIAKNLSKKDFEVLVILILIEVVVAIIEYIVGVNTFFTWNPFYEHFDPENKLLYFSRPLGLSSNSSLLALKALISILLIERFGLFKRFKWVAYGFLFSAFVLTFSRTVIFSVLIFYFLLFVSTFLKDSFLHPLYKIKYFYNYFIIIFIIFFLGVFFLINFSNVENQMTRNGKPILSGREMIWPQFKNFIEAHPVFGNHSKKLLVDYHESEQVAHAHNSYLETLASQGIIIFGFFLLLIFLNLSVENFIFIFVLLIYSLTQYGVFWGISLTDIILFAFFQPKNHYLSQVNIE